MRSFLPLISVVAIAFGCAACGDAGDPLGGPYGGTTSDPGPSAGNGSGGGSGTQDVSGNDGDGGSTGSTGGTGSGGGTGGGTGGGGTGGGGTGGGTGGGGTGGGGTGGGGTGGGGTTAPTWSQIYSSYLAAGKEGNCGASGCHSQMHSATSAYSWLQGYGQINGTSSSAIGDPNQSILSWMGGSMPKRGPTSDPTATSDIEAWAAAGAQNN